VESSRHWFRALEYAVDVARAEREMLYEHAMLSLRSNAL